MLQPNLQQKYKQLVDAASAAGVKNLHVREQAGVLYIDGEATSGDVKDRLWDIYNSIDPDFRSGDLIMNINVSAMASGAKAKVVTESSNLNIRKGPGTHQTVVGVAPHHSFVTLISKSNDQWWLVKTEKGVEGYAYSRYLEVQ